MQKTIKIIKREFKSKVMTRGFLIGTLLGPIILIGFIFLPAFFLNLSQQKPLKMQVVDRSTILADKLTQVFDDTLSNGQKQFILSIIDTLEYAQQREKFRQKIEDGEIDVLLIIPADIIEGGTLIYMSKSVSNVDLIRNIRTKVNEAVNRIRLRQAGLDPDQIQKLTSRLKIKTIKVVKGSEEEKGVGQEFIISFIFLMILYTSIIFYGNSILRGVVEEKTSRVIEVILSSSNSFQLMMGKLIGQGSVGLLQYSLWALLGIAAIFIGTTTVPDIMSNVSVSPTVFLFFILFFLIGYFQFSTLYAAVGAMCSSQEDAQTLSAPVTILVILPFMVSFMVIREPTSSLAHTLSLIPFFTPMLMFLRISLIMPPIVEILTAILINVGAIIVFTWITARIYRVGILMYGKRPTVPEIIRWIRYQ